LIIATRFPGAAQHGAKRNDALQTRDRNELGVCDDPGSAAHRFTLRRIRETHVWVAVRALSTLSGRRKIATIRLTH
jgi:hypothetical protein